MAAASLTKSEARRARARWTRARMRAARACKRAPASPRLATGGAGAGDGSAIPASACRRRNRTDGGDCTSSLSFFSLGQGLQDAHHDEAARRIQAGCCRPIRKLLWKVLHDCATV